MLFDPAGTSGGAGFYLEYRYLLSFGHHDLNSLFETFLQDSEHHTHTNWDYGSLAIGLVVPLAVRIVSSQ